MADQILHNHLKVLKLLNLLKDVETVQSDTIRQFNTLTFSFKHDGQGLPNYQSDLHATEFGTSVY